MVNSTPYFNKTLKINPLLSCLSPPLMHPVQQDTLRLYFTGLFVYNRSFAAFLYGNNVDAAPEPVQLWGGGA